MKIVHMNLAVSSFVKGDPDSRPRMRGAGSIDLCQPCWEAAVKESRIRRGRPKS